MSIIQSDKTIEPAAEIAISASIPASILGTILDGYECPAILVSIDYQIIAYNHYYEEAFGRLALETKPHCFKVSHGYDLPCDQAGESCPLAAVRTSNKKERVLHIHQTPQGKEHVNVEMLPIHDQNDQLLYFVELLRPVPLASGKLADQEMVGNSRIFSVLLETISRVGNSDASALLMGESGTGKELAARAIHLSSKRKNKPMVTLECAGLTDSLFESELFGHVKGAFTGAHANKIGLIDIANGGTLFLDEIADIPLSMQVKLLRLLESGTYRRVGSAEVKTSDFRLIAATHKNLLDMVDQGKFRQDLYYRINVFPIYIPSLAERKEDIPLIAKALIEKLSEEAKCRLTHSAMALLSELSYRGNIRELRNILSRALVLRDTNLIDDKIITRCVEADQRSYGLKTTALNTSCAGSDLQQPVDLKTAEANYLRDLMDQFGNKEKVAEIAGISLRSLYRKLGNKINEDG